MKKIILIGVALAVVAVSLASVNAKPSLPNIPGIDPKTLKGLQQGAETVTHMNEANQAWSYKEERATGRVLAARVAASFGGISKNKAWNDYVNKIGRGLVPFSNRPDIKYRFAILNSNDVNAYSCPGGYIFVTKGLLKQVKSEAQLAGVLAHEIAHVSEKHIEKEVRKQKVAGVALEAGLSYAASEGKIDSQQVDVIKKLSDASYEILVKKGYAREDEFEADKLAVKTMARMGYNPAELAVFIRGLGSAKSGSLELILSTHPASEDRAKAIEDQMKGKKWDGLAVLAERLDAIRKANPL
jgi:beta-barrel assembly-enhancing protease